MRPHPRRTVTDPSNPRAWGTSDQNGMIGQHERMVWQYQWAGTRLINTHILVHPDELDEPQPQLRTIVIPPDPLPIMNARPEQYAIDEVPVSTRVAVGGAVLMATGPGPLRSIRIISGDFLGYSTG